MKIVLDTNVFLSGVYFDGVPGRILEAWRDHQVDLVLSVAILEEYRRASEGLAGRFPGSDINRLPEIGPCSFNPGIVESGFSVRASS